MKTIFKTIVCLLSLTVMLSACYYDEVAGFEGLPSNVSFKNDVSPIFTSNCTATGCHDAQGSHVPSLVIEKSYNALLTGQYVNITEPERSRIYMEIESGGMPPSGPLSVSQKKIILAWITEGAKNN